MIPISLPILLSPLVPGASPASGSWTILFYGGSDNSSEESFCPDMAEMMGALDPSGPTVLLFVDRSREFSSDAASLGEDFAGARLFRCTREGPVRTAGGEAFPDLSAEGDPEVDSADARTLAAAIRWAKATAPAEHTALVFYTHGSGRSWCPDETDSDALYPAELTDVLEQRDSLDLVVFDVCSMAGIENAYQWRPRGVGFSIGHVVATPMAGFPFPWYRILGRLRAGEAPEGARPWIAPPRLSPADFARIVVEESEQHRREALENERLPADLRRMIGGEAMAAMDLSRAAAAKGALDRLAVALAGWDGAKDALEGLVGSSEDPAPMHYFVDGEPSWLSMPYLDLFDLAARLADLERAPAAARERAREVAAAVDELVVASYGLAGYDRFGGFQAGRNGVYVVLPDGDEPDGEGTRWGRFAWLAPDRRDGEESYGRYAWCADGATAGNGVVETWFELLDAWYDERDGSGGRNGYAW